MISFRFLSTIIVVLAFAAGCAEEMSKEIVDLTEEVNVPAQPTVSNCESDHRVFDTVEDALYGHFISDRWTFARGMIEFAEFFHGYTEGDEGIATPDFSGNPPEVYELAFTDISKLSSFENELEPHSEYLGWEVHKCASQDQILYVVKVTNKAYPW